MKKTSGLDSYLSKHGFKLSPVHSSKNEGYASIAQRAAFASELKKHTHIKRILEIGFNAGHTSELFLKSCPEAEIVSFDLNYYPYTAVSAQYISSKYQDRFTFIEGNSRDTVPAFAEKGKFDLIFIDGGHYYEICLQDIQNCARLAHQNTLLWIDDFNCQDVLQAVTDCEEQGLIRLIEAKTVSDRSGSRCWIEACYKS
jgi:predicted O-methyltransferase YrrM